MDSPIFREVRRIPIFTTLKKTKKKFLVFLTNRVGEDGQSKMPKSTDISTSELDKVMND